ncbi:MAG TPA: tetratricopeptide repeat protein, partial [Herpetosiphonaceae bacterium]|nr:tetratricopeptide repeat protein [Herpetosiphonaceae bacterium]
PPAATGPTVALREPEPTPAAQRAPGPPAAPPAPATGYQVPHADGSPSLAGVADPQPCPRCGKPTRLAERRCRSCGFSLMQKVERAGKSRALAIVPGVMSLVHHILYLLLGLGMLILLLTTWSNIKRPPPSLVSPEERAAYEAQIQPMIDELYETSIEPALTSLVVFSILAGLGIAISVGIIRVRRWAYWAGWIYNGLFWLYYLAVFVYTDRIITFIEPIVLGLPTSSGNPGRAKQVLTIVRGIGLFPALYFTILIVFLAFAWRLFTSGSARFVAMDPPSGDPADHFNRGIAYRRQGMWYQSMVEWERAVELSPGDPTYRHALGLVYAQLKRPAEAQRELAEALSLDPNNLAILQDAQKLGVSG